MNLLDGKTWNIAAMGKDIWQVTMKEDNLWVKWVPGVYICNDNFWTHIPPHDASWAWKKLCKLRQKFVQGYTNGAWTMQSQGLYFVNKAYWWLLQTNSKVQWRFLGLE